MGWLRSCLLGIVTGALELAEIRPAHPGIPPGSWITLAVSDTGEGLDDETIEVVRAVAPGDHIVGKTEDLHEGEPILRYGHVIRPQDIGALAGVGMNSA